jgi:hypothetical protein
MSDVQVQLVGLTNLGARLDAISPALQDKLRVFFARFTLGLRDQVRSNIFMRFRVRGGEFPQAVQAETIEEVGSVTGRVFIDTLPYAAIQEYGGQTAPHVIEPVTARVLAFMAPGSMGLSSGGGSNGLIFAKRVNHPGSRIPERSYMRLALVQQRAPVEGGIRDVVNEALSESFAIAAE